jgi:site-specific recombinase XerD
MDGDGSKCRRSTKDEQCEDTFRHAIAVHLLDAGADVAFVQDRLGHANIQNTIVYMRYTTVTRDAQTRQLFASHRVV